MKIPLLLNAGLYTLLCVLKMLHILLVHNVLLTLHKKWYKLNKFSGRNSNLYECTTLYI
jgi:hypothetical protein